MASYSFTSRLIDYAISTANTSMCKAWLKEHAPRMNKAEKNAADKAVVIALSKRYEVDATESQRPEFSGLTFKDNTARQALFKARDILRGGTVFAMHAHHVDPVEKAAKMLAKLTASQALRALKKAEALR